MAHEVTTISGCPNATLPLTGAERVVIDQVAGGDSATVDCSTADIAGLATASVLTIRIPVRNNSGASIAKGQAVYLTGSSGTTITVALADASAEATAARTLGLMEATTANNTDGYVVSVGLLSGLNTSALTEGAVIWLSETTGGMTTTRPTQPAHGVVLGYCVKQGPGTSGEVYVKVDNGLELNELHDVLVTGATAGQLLRLAADGLWKPATLDVSEITNASSVGLAAGLAIALG